MSKVIDRMNDALCDHIVDGHPHTGHRIVLAFADYDSYSRIFEGYRLMFASHLPDPVGTSRPLLYKGLPVVHGPEQEPGKVTIEPIPEGE